MRRLLLILLIIAGPAHASDVCAPDYATQYVPLKQRYQKGLIFRIEQCGKKPSYLFGTMHSDDPEVLAQATPAFQKAAAARLALFELIMDQNTQAEAAIAMQLPPTQRRGLRDMIGEAYFARLARALSATLPEQQAAINRFTPWAAAILLQVPELKGNGLVLDDRLQKYAQKHGVEIGALETPKEQFAIFQNLSEKDQITMLTDTLDRLPEVKASLQELETAYENADLRKIEQLGEASFDEIGDRQLEQYLREALLTVRNREMVKDILPELEKGEIFVAVGALHLPSDEGILRLLEGQGYYITAMD